MQKACMKCGIVKPIGEFYRQKSMRDGHLNKCKSCTIADVKQYRRDPKYRERVLAYDRSRGNRQGKDYQTVMREQNPAAYRARTALGNAVRDGRISKPDKCEHCGKADRLHGHHHDYSKPLAVVWLCAACHKQHHAMMDLIERSMTRGGDAA